MTLPSEFKMPEEKRELASHILINIMPYYGCMDPEDIEEEIKNETMDATFHCMQEYADQESASLKSKYDALGLDYSDLQNRNIKLVEETASLRKELEESQQALKDTLMNVSNERAKSAKLVEDLKGMIELSRHCQITHYSEVYNAISALAEYEGKGGGNG